MGLFSKKKKKNLTAASAVEDAGGAVNKETQEAIISDPMVQEALKNAGEQAMNDPKVQQAIIQVAKDNLTPENAQKVADKAKEWANDPEVQAKAQHYAGLAMAEAGKAGQAFVGCIEQGPTGVRFLAFCGGVASVVNAVMTIINPMNAFAVASYVIAVFMMGFALTTVLFEANPEQIQKVSGLSDYHDMLIEYAKFLTTTMGRGCFYIFQGMMWVSLVTGIAQLFMLITGLFLCFIGVLHVLMHFGIMPEQVATKAKAALGDYQRVGGPA